MHVGNLVSMWPAARNPVGPPIVFENERTFVITNINSK